MLWDTRFVSLRSINKGPTTENLRSVQALESALRTSKWSESEICGRFDNGSVIFRSCKIRESVEFFFLSRSVNLCSFWDQIL